MVGAFIPMPSLTQTFLPLSQSEVSGTFDSALEVSLTGVNEKSSQKGRESETPFFRAVSVLDLGKVDGLFRGCGERISCANTE
jgi:hypothetical protein